MTQREQKAGELFAQGYNCSQSIAICFCDVLNMDEKTAARLSGGFGGGVGRMREVCGAFCGLTIVLSTAVGYETEADIEGKKRLYAIVQRAGEEFKKQNGFLRCRDLLGLPQDNEIQPTPEKRTAEYYKRRPCRQIVESAAAILEVLLKESDII